MSVQCRYCKSIKDLTGPAVRQAAQLAALKGTLSPPVPPAPRVCANAKFSFKTKRAAKRSNRRFWRSRFLAWSTWCSFWVVIWLLVAIGNRNAWFVIGAAVSYALKFAVGHAYWCTTCKGWHPGKDPAKMTGREKAAVGARKQKLLVKQQKKEARQTP
jgi:hypothetical protein